MKFYPKEIINSCKKLQLDICGDFNTKKLPSLHTKGILPGTAVDVRERTRVKVSTKDFQKFDRIYQEYASIWYTKTDLEIFFVDWWINCRKLGANPTNYFRLELMYLPQSEREKFLMYKDSVQLRELGNKNKKSNKYMIYKKFSGTFLNRNWVYPKECSFNKFCAFIKDKDQIFVKPMGGSQGKDAGSDFVWLDDLETLYNYYIERNFIIEDKIIQHQSLQKLHSRSLNTVRVWTFLDKNKKCHIMGACIRIGINSSEVDNFEHGGMGAAIDLNTGIVISSAVNAMGERFSVHPNTLQPILGFQYPQWDKIKSVVKSAAEKMYPIRHIGWDIVTTDKNTVEIVEANFSPGMDLLQSADRIGKKQLYKKLIDSTFNAKSEKKTKPKSIKSKVQKNVSDINIYHSL